ncbi:MAG: MogA/MoaB family molybdenum cofactor biosynthesis protein [Nitrospirae bacterium]|nr:MogA/MoaB family molybdenum cofactor biosynthesis protein [Candidatus Troglogloeales bacterium]MBI3598811.1 MogA/MoaB family molybdenum cofactor biosynthesis protein [Candidatus Troglogloeales bacterium]
MYSVGILTISDKGAAGEREDQSGRLLHQLVEALPGKVICYEIVPDEQEKIQEKLILFCDQRDLHLILTTGGTGPSPRDVTPEATQEVIRRSLPGMAEVLRMQGYQRNPMAILSRGVAGIRDKTLIVNLPGSPQAISEGWALLLPVLPHCLDKMLGDQSECGA